MLRIAQQLMGRGRARADKVGRQLGSLHPGMEALRQSRNVLSTKNMTALPQGEARPVKPELREPEYRNRRERETPEILPQAGDPNIRTGKRSKRVLIPR